MLGLISAGIGLASGLFGSRESREEKESRRRLNQAAGEERTRSNEADHRADYSRGMYDSSRAGYLERLRGFDPSDYLDEKVSAIGERFQENFQAAEASRDKANNRRGFMGSPVGTGAMTRDLNSRLSRELSDAAFQTAGLEMAHNDRYGDVTRMDLGREQFDRGMAEDTRRNYLDLLAGNRDAATDRGNSRRSSWGNAISGAGALYMMGR